MKRREFLTVGSACLILASGRALAEPSRSWRVALATSGQGDEILGLIRVSLASLGYEEGKNLIIDFREANGRYSVLPDLIAELIARKPDVIIAEATPAIAAAQKATSVIPIVMAPATDPIGSGFVQSFTHPGGNITGVANMFGDLTAKTLDIVRLVFPSVKKIGVLISNNPTHPALLEVARAAATAIGIVAEGFIARNPEDIEAAFVQMKEANCEVVYVLADPPRPVLPSIALKFALPTIFQVSTYVRLGGLMSYGPNIGSFFTKAAQYVDRILKGGQPADLPVEQPTTFDFIINLRTAKALGLIIPERVLLMADQVIE
jgi:putative tryptophan/tyrosine transport system substrate-binding protein